MIRKVSRVVALTILILSGAFGCVSTLPPPIYVVQRSDGVRIAVEAKRCYCSNCGWWADVLPDQFGNYPLPPVHSCQAVYWAQAPGPPGVFCWNYIGPTVPGFYWDVRFQRWHPHHGYRGHHRTPPSPPQHGGGHHRR